MLKLCAKPNRFAIFETVGGGEIKAELPFLAPTTSYLQWRHWRLHWARWPDKPEEEIREILKTPEATWPPPEPGYASRIKQVSVCVCVIDWHGVSTSVKWPGDIYEGLTEEEFKTRVSTLAPIDRVALQILASKAADAMLLFEDEKKTSNEHSSGESTTDDDQASSPATETTSTPTPDGSSASGTPSETDIS